MQENYYVFLNSDLLLHEKEFNALRDFMQNKKNQSTLKPNCCIDYSLEKECINISSLISKEDEAKLSKNTTARPELYANNRRNKLCSGYDLLTINTLKKLLCM